eukprot:TRINITY_DN28841_c0_g1_i1.p1 TRINITY_DN28841_c0_g1~~TRINITY_DN28841_c0_g1_i1.p1  ORF type:complete len:514 (-),score=95.07 TRINITY_DN28841_c0_g1_i1:121-1662(-)
MIDPVMMGRQQAQNSATSKEPPSRYEKLRKAVEQMFSDENLNRDKQLGAQVYSAPDGWLDVTALLQHDRMLKLAERHGEEIDSALLCHELQKSSILEVLGSALRRIHCFVPEEEHCRRREALEAQKITLRLMSREELEPIMISAAAPGSLLREVFARHGCVLVTDVLDEAQCAMLELLWAKDLLDTVDDTAPTTDFVAETLQHVREHGVSAWPSIWKSHLGSKGCASQRGLPHGRFAWAARLHPEVRRVFEKLFDEEQLCVGLDVVFWAAADADGPAAEDKQWLHVDQNFCSGLTHLCAQGILYVWPSCDEHASTTALWPRSHLSIYQQLMQDQHAFEKGKKRSQSVRINDLQNYSMREDLVAQGVASTRRVPCPRGSLLLWDSRTIHQGWAGGPRLAQPVCWEPKHRRDAAARLRKVYCCATGVPTSHSSSEGRVHGMARPGRPTGSQATKVKPAMKVTIPFCVAPGQEAAWQGLQEMLWPGANPVINAKKFTAVQGATIEAVLRQEILDVL